MILVMLQAQCHAGNVCLLGSPDTKKITTKRESRMTIVLIIFGPLFSEIESSKQETKNKISTQYPISASSSSD